MDKRLNVKVIPRSSQEKIVKVVSGELKVYVHTAPEGGKANDTVIGLIAEYFGVAKSAVKIVRGETSRKKIVEIQQ